MQKQRLFLNKAWAFMKRTFPTAMTLGIIAQKDTCHSHNISENYIQFQIGKTFENLEVGKLETLFLHNPEVQFHIKTKKEVLFSIQKGFEYLESLAEANKIDGYGISTWTGFQNSSSSMGFTVNELFSIATNIAGKNHVQVLRHAGQLVQIQA